jgi:hypothetical protein
MSLVDWNALTSIASLISMVAFVLTALYVRAELKGMEKDRYVEVTSQLFNIWQSKEFMEAQLWLLHRLEETTWQGFVMNHRGDVGESAFHRVGGFYDRVGTLTRLGIVNDREILSTIGAHAIAVWQKIEPLVRESRRIENSALFDDFERLLPACYECYVPALGAGARVNPFSMAQAEDRIEKKELKRLLDRHMPVALLDVRQDAHFVQHPQRLPGAIRMPPDDVAVRYHELPPDTEIIVYCA